MLEQLFSRSLSRYTSSPRAADLDAFATMVAARGLDNRRTERHTRRLLRVLEAGALPPNATIGADALRAAFGAWPNRAMSAPGVCIAATCRSAAGWPLLRAACTDLWRGCWVTGIPTPTWHEAAGCSGGR